jgi:serine protease Do
MTRLVVLALVIAILPMVGGQPPQAEPAKTTSAIPTQIRPWFVDDERFFEGFMEKLTDLAADGKCLAHKQLLAQKKPGRKVKLMPAKPGNRILSPEEVYASALPSVFVIGSVYKDKDGDWVDGLYATAWVAGSDGILVTNWHVFEELQDGEVFGAVDYKGNVYPLMEFLGGDKLTDVAIVRINAKGLTPLPIADEYAAVGSWVAVLGHPGDNFYVFTTGAVTRFSTNKVDAGRRERWMGVTADYAGGSSGSPVLNKHGAVVGMAALTLTIDDGHAGVIPPSQSRRRVLLGQSPRKLKLQPPVAPPPREKLDAELPVAPPPQPQPPVVQMILKMAVPGPTILRSFEQ